VRDLFRRAGIDTAELDARLLAEAAFGLERLELVNREREPAPAEGLKQFEAYARRRLEGEPVVRILGEQEFWGLKFRLNAATLVPRPDTELLVERALAVLPPAATRRMLDLGTGTGCIPISILTERPRLGAVAVDLVSEALEMARFNAERHRVASRFDTRHGSWFTPLEEGERFDLATSNPPYIDTAEIETLMVEVRNHDPHLALDGGADGLDAYRIIAAGARDHLKADGVLLLEIGFTQAKAVSRLLAANGFTAIQTWRDLGGRDRVVSALNAVST